MNHQQVNALRGDPLVPLRLSITRFRCATGTLFLGWSASHAHRIADPQAFTITAKVRVPLVQFSESDAKLILDLLA